MCKAVCLLVVSLLVLSTTTTVYAAPKGGELGLGAILGTIGAVNGKYWFSKQAAVDLGVEFLDHPFAVFYTDFLWHFPGLFGKGSKFGREASLYLGAGVGAGFWTRADSCGRWDCNWTVGASGTGTGFLARVVVGSEWYPLRTRFGVFAEIVPSFMLFPNGDTIDVGVGGRYYF